MRVQPGFFEHLDHTHMRKAARRATAQRQANAGLTPFGLRR